MQTVDEADLCYIASLCQFYRLNQRKCQYFIALNIIIVAEAVANRLPDFRTSIASDCGVTMDIYNLKIMY